MNNMWHNYKWTAVNFRTLTVSIYQGHIWWISCLRSKHLEMQNAKIHLTFNLKASSAWKKCTGCSSARYGKDQIQIECFKVCVLQTFTYFLEFPWNWHFWCKQLVRIENIAKFAITVQVTLWSSSHQPSMSCLDTREDGQPPIRDQKISFSLLWKVLMKPGFVCHMRAYQLD